MRSVAYKVRHTTRFAYPVPVTVCQNIVCLSPRPGPRLTVHSASLIITPQPAVVADRMDAFGNVTHAFSIEETHDELTIHAETDVVVSEVEHAQTDTPWEQVVAGLDDQSDANWFEASAFRYGSALAARDHAAFEYIQRVFTPGRPIHEASVALTELVHREFAYKPGATHVGTTSTEALRNREGVCQDFAHAMLAALRSVGVAARYVSGYLRTIPPKGQAKLVGADQSHAWVSVYMGPALGWVELDPTNNMHAQTDHIPVAFGRDYGDIAPIRGAFLGGGASRLSVSVDVEQRRAELT